jgi:hypothetical protein
VRQPLLSYLLLMSMEFVQNLQIGRHTIPLHSNGVTWNRLPPVGG